jgi:hypothetical protein
MLGRKKNILHPKTLFAADASLPIANPALLAGWQCGRAYLQQSSYRGRVDLDRFGLINDSRRHAVCGVAVQASSDGKN